MELLYKLCLFLSLIPLSSSLDWDSDIVTTDEEKIKEDKDHLSQYFNETKKNADFFPSWHNMSKLIGPFEDVDEKKIHNHDYTKMTAWLKETALAYPNITSLYSAGKSTEGRDLWVLIISDNPTVHEELEPEIKLVGNMHGNEVVGRETILYLIDVLCKNYGKNEWLSSLVDGMRIHLMPSMNPDGYERGFDGDRVGYTGRENVHGIDLNRNFPPKYPNHREKTSGLYPEKETVAVMAWLKSYPFVLSANLHGGSLVANYPMDDSEDGRDGVYTPSEDDRLFVELAYRYARAHSNMWKSGRRCGLSTEGDVFINGITNGAGWYHLAGGMQDWQYRFTNSLEITVEMGCFKFPTNAMYPKLWEEHKFALLSFIALGMGGVRGIVRDSNGQPVANATILVDQGKPIYSTPQGEYWRILPPGDHTVTIVADSYESESFSVSLHLPSSVVVRNVSVSSCSSPVDKGRSVYRRGQGKTRIAIIGYSSVSHVSLSRLLTESCLSSSPTQVPSDLSLLIIPSYSSAHSTTITNFQPKSIIVITSGAPSSVIFSQRDTFPPQFHKDNLDKSLAKAIPSNGACKNEGSETRLAQEVDTFNVEKAFSLSISIGCEGEEDYDKRWAAIFGTVEMVGRLLSSDSVSEYSVLPSANPLDHFSPTEALLSTSASLSIFENEQKCAHRIEHDRLTITAVGTGRPPFTLVTAIEKRTESFVYEYLAALCNSTLSRHVELKKRGTILFVPEIPNTQQNCHDYGSIDPFRFLFQDVQSAIPSLDMAIFVATGGLKVRYLDPSGHGLSKSMGEAYKKEQQLIKTAEFDVCSSDRNTISGGRTMSGKEALGGMNWSDTQWEGRAAADALLLQVGCCYEERASSGHYGDNEKALTAALETRTRGFSVPKDASLVRDMTTKKEWRGRDGAVFVPLSYGVHQMEIEWKNGNNKIIQFTITTSHQLEEYLPSSLSSFPILPAALLAAFILIIGFVALRQMGVSLYRRPFSESTVGFERIPLYISEDEDEDDVIDIRKL
ncbi:hypothetical protein PFISCL1PPCAC_19651 [Pristionchus fissidentatus]|uniref:Peptidase M14 domain-containing protein n=1 Tax=Pristionchus fissidentatus TaxID=1538716 RepID=A0AAV5W8Q4_9BILA|nr:hypothetical protein PFISCL1PPCAC_19651 [Pristionchus fissidentatus]